MRNFVGVATWYLIKMSYILPQNAQTVLPTWLKFKLQLTKHLAQKLVFVFCIFICILRNPLSDLKPETVPIRHASLFTLKVGEKTLADMRICTEALIFDLFILLNRLFHFCRRIRWNNRITESTDWESFYKILIESLGEAIF